MESIVEWVRGHTRQVGMGAIGVAAIVAGAWILRGSNATKAAGAAQALGEAQRSVATGNLALATADLQKVVQRYGSTTAGRQARLLLAQVQFQQGKVADGLKTLDEIGDGGYSAAAVHAVRAAGLEQSGKPADAAEEYLKAAGAATLDAERESFRSDAARAYAVAGKKAEALAIWQVMADDPSSVLNSEARLRIGELSGTVASR